MFGKIHRRMFLTLGAHNPHNTIFIADVELSSQEEVIRIDHLSTEIGTIQSLRNSFQPILTTILTALDAPAIFMRTKALRALGQIVTSDAAILSSVRRHVL